MNGGHFDPGRLWNAQGGDPARKESLESLTERELQVAHLVVDRRTNAEIADALFFSPKTVETHIRNIFHKLDTSSRVELARKVERTADPAHTRPPGERPRTDSQLHRR